jgi:hypothetical protein
MPADHDDELQDDLLRRVVAELRRPVRLDPAVDLRALREIREGPAKPTTRTARVGRWAAGAALAAGLLLAVFLRPAADPVTPAPVAAVPAGAPAGTRPVSLRLAAPASSRVTVVGDFNDWDPAGTPLRPTGVGGIWTVELRLKPGRYHYAFLIDGRRWEGDPSEPRAPESDFGAPVSVLTVS